MSVKNITASFKTTGIVPFNPSALELVSESQEPTLTTSSNLAYIPFYSPCHKCAQRRPFLDSYSANEDDGLEASIMMPEFEEKEGSASVDESIVVLAERSKSFMNLQVPSPIYKTKMHQPKKSSRVLTSEENLRLLKEKEKKKTEEAEKKRKKKEEKDKKREENAKKNEEDAKEKDQTEKVADAIRSKLDCPDFTEEELILFKQRYDNSYDLLHDERYNLWVKLKMIEDTSTGRFN